VDAVAAVFPFGSEPFVRLREEFWLRVIEEAARAERSLIFTFAPEPTVRTGFPRAVVELVERFGGTVHFVALGVSADEQERRLDNPSRSEFGKLRSVELLRQLRDESARCEGEMPQADIRIDTSSTSPREIAQRIAHAICHDTSSPRHPEWSHHP
jgi:hypothetical protein